MERGLPQALESGPEVHPTERAEVPQPDIPQLAPRPTIAGASARLLVVEGELDEMCAGSAVADRCPFPPTSVSKAPDTAVDAVVDDRCSGGRRCSSDSRNCP